MKESKVIEAKTTHIYPFYIINDMSGVKVELPSHADLASGVISPDTSDDTKGNTFLETPDPLRFWNGLADPDASTRRLYTNVLYVSLLDVINMRFIVTCHRD